MNSTIGNELLGDTKRNGKSDSCLNLPTFFPYRLSVAEIAVSKAIAKLYTDRLGLSQPEWRAFAALGDLQPAAGVDVARYTGLDKMQVTRAISHLVNQGLVVRVDDDNDRRRMMLKLTGKGMQTLRDLAPKARAREAFILEALSKEERVTLNNLLDKVENSARRMDAI